jgi:tetratricopeptide (TPR) repeat protein
MTAWYRNEDWSNEIAADFERRLARSRHQKAQNLTLQGYHLIARHPDVALDLLQRAVELDDPFEAPRALAFMATAHLALGDVDGALDAYEAALERQIAQPNVIAVQPADYLFVVGLFQRTERLALAEPIADALPDQGLFGPDPQVHAAKALVYQLAGRPEHARGQAQLALPLMNELPDVAALGIDIADLRRRMALLAESAA